MSTNHRRRIATIAEHIAPSCRTCFGFGFAVVVVPEGDDPDAAEWNPTHCRECGTPLRAVQKIVGDVVANDATIKDGSS